jgi:hypothetical protein
MMSGRLTPLITAARVACENEIRLAFNTQSWLLKLDGFPGYDGLYNRNDYPGIRLPKPPFQSIQSFQYVDTAGILQALVQDVTYGNSGLFYGYQLSLGSDSQPARLIPSFARPWPPSRLVPNNVLVQFTAGYGGTKTVSIAASATAITGATFLQTDIGRPLSIPGAGPAAATLMTSIAAVDGGGNATVANAAATSVTNASAYLGNPVPGPILMGIKFLTQFYYEQGASTDQDIPKVVRRLIGPYCNNVS